MARLNDHLDSGLSMIQAVPISDFLCSLSEILCPNLDSLPKLNVLYDLDKAFCPTFYYENFKHTEKVKHCTVDTHMTA